MKLLLFSDLHTNIEKVQSIVERSARFDVLVGAGDFATCRRGLEPTIVALSAIKTPTVIVPGNNESYEELIEACANWPAARILHGSETTVAGVSFFGIGGGIPVTPFGAWSYDFTEEQAEDLLSDCPKGCVVISHSPPNGAVDLSSAGKRLGSTAVRDAVIAKSPRLVVCGHIHDCSGRTEYIGEVPVVNAGPLGVEWRLQ